MRIDSALPKDSGSFERNRSAIAAGDRSGGIVIRRTIRRCRRTIGVAMRCADQLPHARHLHPHRCASVYAVGIKLYPHGLRVEVIEIGMYFEHVLRAIGFNLDFAEA